MLKYKSGTFRRIDKKIENSFVIVLVVAVLSVIVSYLVIKTNQDKTAELINETNPTLLQINKLQLLVNNSAFYTSGAIYNPQENFYADSLRQLKNKEYIKVKSKLMALNKPENSDYFSINKCINTYDHLLSAEDELITHLYAGINNGDTANVKKAIVSLQTNIKIGRAHV